MVPRIAQVDKKGRGTPLLLPHRLVAVNSQLGMVCPTLHTAIAGAAVGPVAIPVSRAGNAGDGECLRPRLRHV